MQVHQELLEQHPEFRVQLGLLETQTRSRLANARTSQEPVSIAVVVHVVYHDPQDNIDKAQIDSQIDALNRDYGASNNDKGSVPTVWSGLVANPQITFVLATRDPQGGATDGVTRTQTATASFGTDDTVKSAATGGVDPWPTDQYLNIWVCALGSKPNQLLELTRGS